MPVPTVFVAYWATGEAMFTFVASPASPEGTLTRDSCDASVIAEAVVRSYVRVEATTSEPLIVSGRAVMFAVKEGCVRS